MTITKVNGFEQLNKKLKTYIKNEEELNEI